MEYVCSKCGAKATVDQGVTTPSKEVVIPSCKCNAALIANMKAVTRGVGKLLK